MKQGKKPTMRQIKAMVKLKLSPDDWFVTKSLPNEIHLIHRESAAERIIPA